MGCMAGLCRECRIETTLHKVWSAKGPLILVGSEQNYRLPAKNKAFFAFFCGAFQQRRQNCNSYKLLNSLILVWLLRRTGTFPQRFPQQRLLRLKQNCNST